MKIVYFFRNPKVGYSIGKVFNTVINEIEKTRSTKSCFLPSPRSKPIDIIKNGFYARRNAEKGAITHITGSDHYLLLFLRGYKTIITLHDLGFYTQHQNSLRARMKYLFWIKSIKFSKKVVCISENTKKELLQYLKLPEEKLHVINNPLPPEFSYKPAIFNSEYPKILHVGTGENKNLLGTIKALYNIPCHLRIIGSLNDAQIYELRQFNIDYSNASHLSDVEIIDEYITCDIVNFPSFYEGFGMPIIEGQATGRVVITSNKSPMNTVAGEGAFFVNPDNLDSLRSAYLKIIGNESMRNQLIQAGLRNIKKYNVENIAKQYIDIYTTM